MLSNSCRASSGARIGVLPRLTTCLGPRTTEAGLLLTTWPATSQSNSIRTAADLKDAKALLDELG
jgi:hypothetical protein